MKKITHSAVMFLFGLLFPVLLLFGTYNNLKNVGDKFNHINTSQEIKDAYTSVHGTLASANDYILYSLIYIEQSNQKTMLNKQAMKLAIIHIGLAVMSVGLMFIILGMNDGGGEGGGNFSGAEFNFKTASSGLVVFMAGALMSSGGALVNNLYTTAAVPGYVQILSSSVNEHQDKTHDLVDLYKSCRKYEENKFQECLVSMVQQLYSEELK